MVRRLTAEDFETAGAKINVKWKGPLAAFAELTGWECEAAGHKFERSLDQVRKLVSCPCCPRLPRGRIGTYRRRK
jgi:hypothetical protein